MASASVLATNLDEHMLLSRSVHIFPSTTSNAELESNRKQGKQVTEEIGGRLLLRYLLGSQTRVFGAGSADRHFVTPTPYAPEDTVPFLALPRPASKREFVILLRPEEINWILGPRWILGGLGIEYILPEGFPRSALLFPWEFKIA